MPTRAIKPRSERGSLKDLAHPQEAAPHIEPPTPSELLYKNLYEYAQAHQDAELQQALGIITTDYIGDKNALPLSVYRLKKIVNDIKSRSGRHISQLEVQFSEHLAPGVSQETIDLLVPHQRIKTASAQKSPVFRRVSE